MESPTKRAYEPSSAQEKPFPGQMAGNYQQSDIEAIRGASTRARSAMGRTLGKTVSAPVISGSYPLPVFSSPPTRAPLHSRDNSLRELQPYGDLKSTTDLDGFDVDEMAFTPPATPASSPSKKRLRDDEEEQDEAIAMDQDSPCPSPTSSPSSRGIGGRILGRAQTEPAIKFDDSF